MLVSGHPQERPVDVSRASYAKCSAVRGCVGYADRSEAASQPLMPFWLSGAFSGESNEISAKAP